MPQQIGSIALLIYGDSWKTGRGYPYRAVTVAFESEKKLRQAAAIKCGPNEKLLAWRVGHLKDMRAVLPMECDMTAILEKGEVSLAQIINRQARLVLTKEADLPLAGDAVRVVPRVVPTDWFESVVPECSLGFNSDLNRYSVTRAEVATFTERLSREVSRNISFLPMPREAWASEGWVQMMTTTSTMEAVLAMETEAKGPDALHVQQASGYPTPFLLIKQVEEWQKATEDADQTK